MDLHGQLLIHGVPHSEASLIGKVGGLQVVVYGSEGRAAPHYHVVKGDRLNPVWQCCVCVRRPTYFHGHDWNGGPLTPKQISKMIKMLRSPFWANQKTTAWAWLVLAWNASNTDHEVDGETEMPDYAKLRWARR